MTDLSFALIFWALMHLVLVIWLISSWIEYRGLKGGYGKGIWAESSPYMIEAEEALATSSISLALLIILDAYLLYLG